MSNARSHKDPIFSFALDNCDWFGPRSRKNYKRDCPKVVEVDVVVVEGCFGDEVTVRLAGGWAGGAS
jgi:hypothetical protein